MKLCQENTELAEKLKSIIDQYELREEVSSALAAGWDGSTLSGCPRGSGSTAGSLAIIRLSLRVAPTVLCPQSSAVPAARSLRCGTAWTAPRPWSRGSLAARERGWGTQAARGVSCLLSCPNPVTAPPDPWGPPPASLSSFPLSSLWVHPSSLSFRQPVLQVTTNIFCSLQKQVAEKGSDVNYLTLSQKQKIRMTDKGDPLNLNKFLF